MSALRRFWRRNYKSTTDANIRTGTKIAVNWLVFSAILIVWLVVGIPWLCLFYPALTAFAPHISNIIIALIGGSTLTYSTSEIRKTVENVKNVTRPALDPDANPKRPFTND